MTETAQLAPESRRALEALGHATLTPIQALVIPPLLAGRDVIAQSKTGSGKTLAYALPLLERVRTGTPTPTLQALVLCPTRELSEQVARTLRGAGRFRKDLKVVSLVGGEPLFHQLRSLRHGLHVAVGTPGRLLDLAGRGELDLAAAAVVVIDEADRMLDMGFREALEKILERTPKARQTALFSATFPEEIEALSARYQRDPLRLEIVTEAADAPLIDETAYAVDDTTRLPTLIRLLTGHAFGSALVFCERKTTVDEVTAALTRAGLRAARLHGDLEQNERDRVMACFRNGTVRLLVATDVAARGLDIEGLDAVVNYEMAKDPTTHVHRIGRTGRAGKTGVALSLWSPAERGRLERLDASREKPLPQSKDRSKPRSTTPPLLELATVEIGGGRRDKLRAGDILGALTAASCGLDGKMIGKIEIRDRVSFVAVTRQDAHRAVQSLQRDRIKGRRFFAALVSPA